MAVADALFLLFWCVQEMRTKMWKKILCTSLVVVMVLSLTACERGTGEEAELPPAQEIVNGVIDSLEKIRTTQFDMNMTMDMAGEAEDETFEATMVMDFSGVLDLANRQMKADITMNIAASGADETDMAMAMYLLDDVAYMMIEVPEMAPMWVKSEVPEATWEAMNQVESQIGLLEAAQVEVIGSETIEGIDCYVLQLTPDMEQLWQVAMQQAEVIGEEMPDIAEELLEEIFRSFSVKQWIAKDTYFLTKAETDMDMELTPEALGSTGEGLTKIGIAMDLLYYNYNQQVSIVLPLEARDAIKVPSE